MRYTSSCAALVLFAVGCSNNPSPTTTKDNVTTRQTSMKTTAEPPSTATPAVVTPSATATVAPTADADNETACKSNLKYLATALEMYSVDNSGHYPTSVSLLTPNYLKVIPTCPASGKDTYSASYQMGSGPDAYTFFCKGDSHVKVGEPTDYPQYNSVMGLVSKVTVTPAMVSGPVGQLAACKNNLKNIATALEMYSTDNSGRYPTSVSQLTPNYLKALPTCPAAGKETYSHGFTSAAKPDAYTLFCEGDNHTQAGQAASYPQYNSFQGLITQ